MSGRIGTKNWLVDVSQILLVGVFLYSAISKVLDYSDYYRNLMRSPLFHTGEVLIISHVVIIIEFATAVMLLIPKTRRTAFGLAFFLLISFSFYLTAIAFFFSSLPCGCGGILSKLGFGPHIVINLLSALFATVGFFKSESSTFVAHPE
jgi:uncharacterized membrane protein YphA (DoxX/SURF4 family)